MAQDGNEAQAYGSSELDDDDNFKRDQNQDVTSSSSELAHQLLTPQIPWTSKSCDILCMTYVSGDDPWEFHLTYKNDEAQLLEIREKIKQMYEKGLLENCSPEAGEFVVCCQKIQDQLFYFRGIVVMYNTKLRPSIRSVCVYKVDYGEKVFLFPEDVYCLPMELASIPSRVVKCRMLDGQHHLKERFCLELKLAFKDVLKHSILTVILGEFSGSLPPCFLADVWAFDRTKCVADVNLCRWIDLVVLPTLERIPPDCSDANAYLQVEVMDPYHGCKVQLDTAVEEQEGEDRPFLQSSEEKLADAGSQDTPHSAPDSTVGFIPPCAVQVNTDGSNEDDYDGVTNLQDEYQPTDERRICLFYQENGWCGRKLCTKEHVEKSSLWTTDTIETYCSTFNDICLPAEGTEVHLTIQCIKSPVSFYVTLSNTISNGSGPGALETSATLHADLNSQQSNITQGLLTAGPQISELVIAPGHQESLGPARKWLRARVIHILDDNNVLVFFIDFGNTEVVKTKDLRVMRPQFLHLPPQAILTRLHNLKPKPDKLVAALDFLKNSILGKELKAIVMAHYYDEIDVILFTEKDEFFDEILVHQDFADKIN